VTTKAERPETILQRLLREIRVGTAQRRFLGILLVIWLAIPGRVNAANFGRYSRLNEKTMRNWFRKSWDWPAIHLTLIEELVEQEILSSSFILGIDTTFIPKSGKHTAGLAKFWNAKVAATEKGLEVSCSTLIDMQTKQAFVVNVKQTQPDEAIGRLKQYQVHLETTWMSLPATMKAKVRAVVADGYYAKKLFMDVADQQAVPLITKLQHRANLKYRYQGEHLKRRGRKRMFAGKVDFKDFSRWELVKEDDQERVITAVLYAPHFKRDLRVVIVQRLNEQGKVLSYAVLCSTDINMNPLAVKELYTLRFQMEFVFRDAKQHAGLTTCQLRSSAGLHAHFNAAFLVVNLTRAQALKDSGSLDFVFSMEDAKRRAYNALFAQHILANLGLKAQFDLLSSLPSNPLDFGTKAA
jgi:putative transposase